MAICSKIINPATGRLAAVVTPAHAVSYLCDTRGGVAVLSVRVPPDVEERLTRLAERTGRSKSFYAREALRAHIDDLEDIYLAEQRLQDVRAGKDAVHSLAELAAEYGL